MSRTWITRFMTALPLPTLATAAEPGHQKLAPLAGSGLVQMILGLILILGLIVGTAWLLRRYTPLRGGDGVIKIVGGLSLGTRERLVLVEVEETRLLIGVAPGRVQTLHVFEGAGSRNSAAFATALTAVQTGQPV